MNTVDTICAVASGVGGAIAIIRLSGRAALRIGNEIWRGSAPLERATARRMNLGKIVGVGDAALAVYMPAPNSYTGEDVVELQCHGGALVSRRVLELAIAAGARLAAPGEFTFRAFVNGKLDLTQAEAVGDIITAGSDIALELAENQLSGALSRRIAALRADMTDILGDVESRLDFPEEHLGWEAKELLADRIAAAMTSVGELAATIEAGRCYREGVSLVIAGRPNVGKSSLLNALLGRDRAIVSDIPGTTRDTLEEFATLRNIPVRLTDTAGIRQGAEPLEALGIERSKRSLRSGEIVFWLLDASAPELAEELEFLRDELAAVSSPVIAIWNKRDLAPERELPPTGVTTAVVSVKENLGLSELLDVFEREVWCGTAQFARPEVAVNERQRGLLSTAIEALAAVLPELENEDWELAAVQLRLAVNALGEITGETAGLDILDNIFSRFCIGK